MNHNKNLHQQHSISMDIKYLQVNALIVGELLGFNCTSLLTMNKKFQYHKRLLSAVLKILISLLVNEYR